MITRQARFNSVVNHYDSVLKLKLTGQEKNDLIEYLKSKFGPFFKCESAGCDWKQNVDAVRRTSRRAGQGRRK